ncbi:hypothetical protein SARC_02163 [Sphaeroforma arctica JP610]|uniref:Hexosyltransferase n=1 Tax=Sphaeroforma arctica JP610 TaxID=667725 RepID=A0A0L0G9U3_9EUKA|nr:hypothetical protein SARC_02163 [Sphaeroforma arctica JP610]KNC85641.1 hypothetical protein SARC_02163 [Sphaeroforma arctica JP610]|eukprot:XP_014159543.1 hypothetical protein SARC_02163 [Sphaeroforma arctica JP610]
MMIFKAADWKFYLICLIMFSCALYYTLSTDSANVSAEYSNKYVDIRIDSVIESTADVLQDQTQKESVDVPDLVANENLQADIASNSQEKSGSVQVFSDLTVDYKVHVLEPDIEGILIAPLTITADGRAAIRRTWGAGLTNRLFFLVAKNNGSWPEDEYNLYKDIVLIDLEEKWGRAVAVKSRVWFAISSKYWTTKWAVKTDEDSYLFYDRMLKQLKRTHADYWGRLFLHSVPYRQNTTKYYLSEDMYPRDDFPPYHSGVGYAVSLRARQCMAKVMPNIIYMPREDVGTGLMIEACKFHATHAGNGRVLLNYRENYVKDNLVVHHGLKKKGEMDDYHAKVLRARKA